jgi:hypothetical protein
MRALASVGIFAEDEQGHFTLTPIAATIQSDVPGSLRAWAIMALGEEDYQAWGDLMHSVRTGESAFTHVFGAGVWQYRAQHPDLRRGDGKSRWSVQYGGAGELSILNDQKARRCRRREW